MIASASAADEIPWYEANRQWMLASLAALRARLGASTPPHGASTEPNGARAEPGGARAEPGGARADREEPDRIASAMSSPPALEQLAHTFDLSAFEKDILLLTAGVEPDPAFAALVAEAQRDLQAPSPTFGLALAVLTDPHWSALAPARPLRRWRLVELAAGGTLTTRPLQIDERVLHHLVGVDYVDHRLVGSIDESRAEHVITSSQRLLANRIVAAWRTAVRHGEPLPVVCLRGGDVGAKHAIAHDACAELGLEVVKLAQPSALDDPDLATLVGRELRLSRAALLVLADDDDAPASAVRWINRSNDPVILSTRDRLWPMRRPVLTIDVEKPLPSEQRVLWAEALDGVAPDAIEPLVSHFDLGTQSILAAASAAAAAVDAGAARSLREAVWDSCRRLSRPRLEGLAQRIEPRATWDDLIVPPALREMLELVATHVARRAAVHEKWSFTRRGSRGLGVTALFSGPSGTGKTLAAEVLAGSLGLELYRVDLSQVVSKYIGETEKNLRRVFEAAEESAAVLLFDEADALFGKRSDVKDSHDRYANIEVSYLLQRMETYRGLAILTTNLKNAVDPAFLRRIQFVAQFPFPNLEQRLAIWSRFFPEGSDVEGLDLLQLAQMNLAGGNIYNVARNAVFLAADAGTPVRMEHLHRAARDEFSKLERPSNVPR